MLFGQGDCTELEFSCWPLGRKNAIGMCVLRERSPRIIVGIRILQEELQKVSQETKYPEGSVLGLDS